MRSRKNAAWLQWLNLSALTLLPLLLNIFLFFVFRFTNENLFSDRVLELMEENRKDIVFFLQVSAFFIPVFYNTWFSRYYSMRMGSLEAGGIIMVAWLIGIELDMLHLFFLGVMPTDFFILRSAQAAGFGAVAFVLSAGLVASLNTFSLPLPRVPDSLLRFRILFYLAGALLLFVQFFPLSQLATEAHAFTWYILAILGAILTLYAMELMFQSNRPRYQSIKNSDDATVLQKLKHSMHNLRSDALSIRETWHSAEGSPAMELMAALDQMLLATEGLQNQLQHQQTWLARVHPQRSQKGLCILASATDLSALQQIFQQLDCQLDWLAQPGDLHIYLRLQHYEIILFDVEQIDDPIEFVQHCRTAAERSCLIGCTREPLANLHALKAAGMDAILELPLIKADVEQCLAEFCPGITGGGESFSG
ncbi:MAG: hypothetical protein KDK39_01940 [Leptospiraceae bacterium]|nr:hypothetical protein [Leptospiraceae bacterium]